MTDLVQADPDHTLYWYANSTDPKGSGSTSVQTVSTATPNVYKFYVSQKNNTTNAESEKATITVTINPLPTVTLTNPPPFCQDELSTEPDKTISGYTINWTSGSEPQVKDLSAVSSPYSYTYTITNNSTTCTGSEHTYTVNVNKTAIPNGDYTVNYLKKDAEENSNTFAENLSDRNPGVAIADADCKLLWFDADKNPLPGVPTPQYDPTTSQGQDKTETYYVAQQNNNTGCISDLKEVTVTISDSPMPIVAPLAYCEGAVANTLTAQINTAYGDNYELIWYDGNPKGATAGVQVESLTPRTTLTSSSLAQETTTYYVTQRSLDPPYAESSASELKVTVYAKPVLTTADPPATCEKPVDITGTWSIANGVQKADVAPFYYKSDKITQVADAGAIPVDGSGTYYIQGIFTVPANAVTGNEYCESGFEQVTVDIHDLNPGISGDPDACPGLPVTLTGSTGHNYNPGVATFIWNGNERINIQGNPFDTGNLNYEPGEEVYINLNVSMGACQKQATPHKITIGNGRVNGTMTVNEDENDYDGTVFTNAVTREFISCGGTIDIKTAYDADAGTPYTWRMITEQGDTIVIDNGITSASGNTNNITIPSISGPRGAGTTTYELKYTNVCETAVKIKIIDIPLTITPLNSKMSLCEGEEFKTELNINCIEDPNVEWSWDNGINKTQLQSSTSPSYTITKATPANTGTYTYKATNKGCKAEGTISDSNGATTLNVSGKISYQKLPLTTVCGGYGDNIGLEWVTPSLPASAFNWIDPSATIQSISPDGLQAYAMPPYNPGTSTSSIYTYNLQVTNDHCDTIIKIDIKVDEPLVGNIDDKVICEGTSTTLDARSYKATTYSWTSSAITGVKTTPVITESPEFTGNGNEVDYYLTMTRGGCQAQAHATITVNSRPVIFMIDSLGARVRKIITLDGFGTPPFQYGVDNSSSMNDNPVKSDLFFGQHTFHVIDAIGCVAESWKYVLEAPKLFPPLYFSPNGDNIKDTWEIEGLKDFYPDAVVTIYDRYGKQIARYKGSAEQGWDGKYLGNEMPTTDYWYIIDIDGINKQYVGHFTLLRAKE